MMRAALGFGCLLLGLAAHVHAEGVTSDDLIHEGIELRRQGDNAAALAVFERAHALEPSPRTAAQIALAHHALGHWVRAEQQLVSLLETHADDPWIVSNAAALEVSLATVREHLGTLIVETNVTQAHVEVDGLDAGTSPLHGGVRVRAGTVAITLRAEGYTDVHSQIAVPAQGVAKASIVMVHTPVTAERTPASPLAPSATARAALPEQGSLTSSPSEATLNTRPFAVASLITAAPLLVAGVTAHVVRENNAAHYTDDDRCFFGGQTRDQRCGAVRDRVETAQTIAIIGYAGAGLAIASGIALLLASDGSTAADSGAAFMPRLSRSSAGVAWHTAF